MTFLQTRPGADPVIVEGIFNAAPERVFRAWTEPDEVVKWFGARPGSLASAEIDLRVGGGWCFVLTDTPEKTVRLEGEYIHIEPARALVFSWRHVEVLGGEHEETRQSRVSVAFRPHGERSTHVRLMHEEIRAEDARIGVGTGWDASFTSLQNLFADETE